MVPLDYFCFLRKYNAYYHKSRSKSMNKAVAKQIFGMPSIETATRIDDSDAANAACAANYRFQSRMHELTAQFEQKASEVRAAYLAELAGVRGDEGE
jgi:hypothetical protein